LKKALAACRLIAKEAIKKENKTSQYFLKRLLLREKIAENKNIIGRLILYVKSILGGINEKGKTNRPERAGRLMPHIRNRRNKPI